jgi:hypothetical protein
MSRILNYRFIITDAPFESVSGASVLCLLKNFALARAISGAALKVSGAAASLGQRPKRPISR